MKIYELILEKEDKQENLYPVDSIAIMLFNKKAGIVTDLKRDKNEKFIGISHGKSNIKTSHGKSLFLTFDNSTDSGEFEIDSLTPLKIEKGGLIDKSIKKLFLKFDVDTKKKIGYLVKDDLAFIREIHLGKKLSNSTVKFVYEVIKILHKINKDDKSEDSLKQKISSIKV